MPTPGTPAKFVPTPLPPHEEARRARRAQRERLGHDVEAEDFFSHGPTLKRVTSLDAYEEERRSRRRARREEGRPS